MSDTSSEPDVLLHLAGLSSAEDIFIYLLLPFDQDVLDVSRLHIMKRFGTYLKEPGLSGEDQDAVFLEARKRLKRAYGDFLVSTPRQEKVFKVFRDEEEKRKARFVAIKGLSPAAE